MWMLPCTAAMLPVEMLAAYYRTWTAGGAAAFEAVILAAYYTVLGVLAIYAAHRFWLVWTYFRYRSRVPGPPPRIERWPRVTVQLPIFNERYVVERLVAACARFDYPRELVEIQVLDDSTDETRHIAAAGVARFQAEGLAVHHITRPTREGFKAGALAEGLKSATGEFIAIFDADFLPPPDFLRRTIPYLAADPGVGMVQARVAHINRGHSALTEVASILIDGHFVIEHGARSRRGLFFNFNGTAGVWRRAAIESAGGWQHDTLTEDTDLSYRAQLAGWKFLYLPDVAVPAEVPVEMNALKAQQARWSKGLIQTARKLLPAILRSRQPLAVKAEAFFHLTNCVSYPLMVLLSVLLLPAMMLRTGQGWTSVLLADLPLFLLSTWSLSMFYLAAQRELHPRAWRRTYLYLPMVMAVGIGLAVRNSIDVIEALAGGRGEFARTPKYRIEARGDTFLAKAYRNPAGWAPLVELSLGLYFAAAIAYALRTGGYATAPFLLLFLAGYWYTGVMSLGQSWFERIKLSLRPAVDPAAV